jgi:hypothetical protein
VTKRVQGDDCEWRDEVRNAVRRSDYFGGELHLSHQLFFIVTFARRAVSSSAGPRAATVSAVTRTDPTTQPKFKASVHTVARTAARADGAKCGAEVFGGMPEN